MSFLSSVPRSGRPALFQSLLQEACGRTVNPVTGAIGLLSTGNWHVCQAAVNSVLNGKNILQPLILGFSKPPSPDESQTNHNINNDINDNTNDYFLHESRDHLTDMGIGVKRKLLLTSDHIDDDHGVKLNVKGGGRVMKRRQLSPISDDQSVMTSLESGFSSTPQEEDQLRRDNDEDGHYDDNNDQYSRDKESKLLQLFF